MASASRPVVGRARRIVCPTEATGVRGSVIGEPSPVRALRRGRPSPATPAGGRPPPPFARTANSLSDSVTRPRSRCRGGRWVRRAGAAARRGGTPARGRLVAVPQQKARHRVRRVGFRAPRGSSATTVGERCEGECMPELVVGRVAPAEPQVLGDRAFEEMRMLGHPCQMCARHASGSSVATSTPPTRSVPPWGARKPSSTFNSVDLPQPLGPASATTSPGSIVSDHPSSTGPARSG